MPNSSSQLKIFRLCLLLTVGLAWSVMLLGAYTRLAHAGLGCPDWPGCYGHLSVPSTNSALQKAAELYPGQTVEPLKAWPEMIHRYFAGTLVVICLILSIVALLSSFEQEKKFLRYGMLLVLSLLFMQAVLGMWTVTWKLLPLVVMSHLLGGMTITATLWSLYYLSSPRFNRSNSLAKGIQIKKLPISSVFFLTAIILVIVQIFLGGWTSANYAAVVCPDFPYCQGTLLPHFDFKQAFNFLSPIGNNYEGGILDNAARVTIHMMHRYGATVVMTYVGCLAFYLSFAERAEGYHTLGWMMLISLIIQISLGVLNIVWQLPLNIAVAHNGMALILLLTLLSSYFYVRNYEKINNYK